MAESFTAGNEIKRVVLSATPDNLTQINLHGDCRTVTVQAFKADGTTSDSCKIALIGTDGGAVGAEFWTVLSGGAFELNLEQGQAKNGAGNVLYIASLTASAIIEIYSQDVGR